MYLKVTITAAATHRVAQHTTVKLVTMALVHMSAMDLVDLIMEVRL